jgi:hypothetical protein
MLSSAVIRADGGRGWRSPGSASGSKTGWPCTRVGGACRREMEASGETARCTGTLGTRGGRSGIACGSTTASPSNSHSCGSGPAPGTGRAPVGVGMAVNQGGIVPGRVPAHTQHLAGRNSWRAGHVAKLAHRVVGLTYPLHLTPPPSRSVSETTGWMRRAATTSSQEHVVSQVSSDVMADTGQLAQIRGRVFGHVAHARFAGCRYIRRACIRAALRPGDVGAAGADDGQAPALALPGAPGPRI